MDLYIILKQKLGSFMLKFPKSEDLKSFQRNTENKWN